MRKPRFQIAVWHGELHSIGRVVDRKTGRVKGETSTFRDGAAWRELLEIQARSLNKNNERTA